MNTVRLRLTSLVALAVYLAVNIGVGALHHHALLPASSRTDAIAHSRLVIEAGASHEDADDQACPICCVIHQVKSFQAPEIAVTALTDCGEAAIDARPSETNPFLSSARSRAPPAI